MEKAESLPECLGTFYPKDQLVLPYFLQIVFASTIITTISATVITPKTEAVSAGRMSSPTAITKIKTVITAIPVPITLHSLFALYFFFSSGLAVL